MKRIRKLYRPTPGFNRYLHRAGAAAKWERFRRNQARVRELVEGLTHLQHGLCGYCEIDLREDDRQIEHVIPRSDPKDGTARELDPTNLIVCCLGGTKKGADDERYRAPTQANISCGQAKGENTDADFIDPRILPALPSLTRVSFSGRIEADQDACDEAGFSSDALNKTIGILGLNVERLRRAREKHWRALNESWKDYFGDIRIMENATRTELLPDNRNCLGRFFTSSRCFFGAYAERVLSEEPKNWI